MGAGASASVEGGRTVSDELFGKLDEAKASELRDKLPVDQVTKFNPIGHSGEGGGESRAAKSASRSTKLSGAYLVMPAHPPVPRRRSLLGRSPLRLGRAGGRWMGGVP